MTEAYVKEIKEKVRLLEENQYQETQRLHIVPPHYVLINPENQAEYDRLVAKDRRRVILEKGFLTNPEGQMVASEANLLAVVNETVFQRPWSKLDLEFQINRILVYLGELSKKTTLANQTLIRLRKTLLNACFRRELGNHQVLYDCQTGRIQEILGLSWEPEVKLEILTEPVKTVPVVAVSQITGIKLATPKIKLKTQVIKSDQELPKKKKVIVVKKKV